MAISKTQPMRPALSNVMDGVDTLTEAIGAETMARQQAVQDVVETIGTEYDTTNTVAAAIAALDARVTALEGN